jgi:glycerol-3-phosphate dehydrogenase subunit C
LQSTALLIWQFVVLGAILLKKITRPKAASLMKSKEGGLKAPTRYPIAWRSAKFSDPQALEAELRRVYDICHSCRRCFNLCGSFPKLFDMIDASKTGELDSLSFDDLLSVASACTLCDMCYLVKCPYVPPHPFNVDFPHLMLRVRAFLRKTGRASWLQDQVSQVDRNGCIGCKVHSLANWTTSQSNKLTRPLLERVIGIDRKAPLPPYSKKQFLKAQPRSRALSAVPQTAKKEVRDKVLLYATCYVNYHDHRVGEAALKVMRHQEIDVQLVYPECCGMTRFEQGDLEDVAARAERISANLLPFLHQGYKIVPLVPSCTLMMRQEWPLLLPQSSSIRTLKGHVYDLSEYLIWFQGAHGLKPGMKALDRSIILHMACHVRAQNKGRKAEELLKLVPGVHVDVIERCSGHGGSWGIFKDNFELALKVGRPVFRQVRKSQASDVMSECPLARDHIHEGVRLVNEKEGHSSSQHFSHPIELIAEAYGL